MKPNCYKCSSELELENASHVLRSEECPRCYANLRCCMMCLFYDMSSYNECREPTADRIIEKEKSNFCDFFKFGNKKTEEHITASALTDADALFRK